MITVKSGLVDNDFRDGSVRRLLSVLQEKKSSIDQAIPMIEGADRSLSLHQLAQSVPYLPTHLSYILGEDWLAQANSQILEP